MNNLYCVARDGNLDRIVAIDSLLGRGREAGRFVITSNLGSLAGEISFVESWRLTEEGRTHIQVECKAMKEFTPL